MPKFFVTDGEIRESSAILTGANAEHIKVLRRKPGDTIIISNGQGKDFLCEIQEIAAAGVTVSVREALTSTTEPSVSCTVLAGFPKGERADYIVQKCTELGANEIIFFLSKRCVARPDTKSMQKKLMRFQKIAESAAKQSGRGIIPRVGAVGSLEEALDIAALSELVLFMYETGDRISLREAIERKESLSSVAIITGPEGGFDPEEAQRIAERGIQPLAMGPRILRCETAPVVVLSALMYATDNLQ